MAKNCEQTVHMVIQNLVKILFFMLIVFSMTYYIVGIAGSYHFDTQLPETMEKEWTDEKKRKELSEDEEENSRNKKKKQSTCSNEEEQPDPSSQLITGQRKKSKKICHPDFHCYGVHYHSVNSVSLFVVCYEVEVLATAVFYATDLLSWSCGKIRELKK